MFADYPFVFADYPGDGMPLEFLQPDYGKREMEIERGIEKGGKKQGYRFS